MLVIFDLDDTLIETSKCLTPIVLIRAFDAMQEAGLSAEARAVEELLAIDKQALTSRDSLSIFLTGHPEKKELLEIGLRSLELPLPKSVLVEPVPHALKVLEEMSCQHTLALVTRGNKDLQFEKMEKAGIQPEIFSKLVVSCGSSKKGDYEAILGMCAIQPLEALVVGDRVPFDLTPGRELGMTTVFFRNGRGSHHVEPSEDVDLTIYCLTELNEVLAHYEV